MKPEDKTSIVPSDGRPMDETYKRRTKIMEIQDQLMTELGHAYPEDIIAELRKSHGINITKRILYGDMKAINGLSTFVLDLSKDNYSATIENCYNILLEISRHTTLIQNQKWSISKKTKTVKEQDEGPPITIIQEQTIEEGSRPILQALAINLHAVNAMLNLFKGDNVDTSVGLIHREFMKIKLRNQELEKENEKLKNEHILKKSG